MKRLLFVSFDSTDYHAYCKFRIITLVDILYLTEEILMKVALYDSEIYFLPKYFEIIFLRITVK